MDFSLMIDPDIRRAATLPARVYTDERVLEAMRGRVFVRSWQHLADLDEVRTPGTILPVMMLEGLLDVPFRVSRDAEDRLHCLSNV